MADKFQLCVFFKWPREGKGTLLLPAVEKLAFVNPYLS